MLGVNPKLDCTRYSSQTKFRVAEQCGSAAEREVQLSFFFLISHPRLQVGNSNNRLIAMLSHVQFEKFVSKIKFPLAMLVSYYSKIARPFSHSSNRSQRLNISIFKIH